MIPLGRQQEVHGGAGFIDRPIQIFPGPFDLHIGLVQSPAGTNPALAGAKLLIQQRGVFHDPTIERGMVNLDAALFQHFLKLPIADWICHIPADAPEDHLTFKMAALELDHRAVPLNPCPAIIPQATAKQSLRQNRIFCFFQQTVECVNLMREPPKPRKGQALRKTRLNTARRSLA